MYPNPRSKKMVVASHGPKNHPRFQMSELYKEIKKMCSWDTDAPAKLMCGIHESRTHDTNHNGEAAYQITKFQIIPISGC